MALVVGARLGPYVILAPIGAGGMGEVYRARDTNLERDVAIKVLPSALAQDPERLARFEREAKVLAALNHPNIAQIYGVEQGALVMELVEGENLSGPVPLATTLDYARQIADALEAAHEKGIVHRDLKPANIKITPQGVVKVLDFGLAAVGSSTASRADASISPTLTLAATQIGVLLGTAGYMSPEQASGKPVDKRADIWSFGVVFWEMLSGKRLFDGETISHMLAAILTKELDWTQLPKGTPASVRNLLKRCLARDLRRRLPDIGAARLELEEAMAGGAADAQPAPASGARHTAAWGATAIVALAGLVLAFVHFRETPAPEHVLRYTIAPPENSLVQSFALSPDGRYLAISAAVNGRSQLWLRAMDTFQMQPIPNTDNGLLPFWSPDSRYIGFFAQNKLKKIAASGGPAQSLCDAVPGGGTWNDHDVILFANSGKVKRVQAAGGIPSDVIDGGPGTGYPVFLPGGRRFIYLVAGPSLEKSGIFLGALDGKQNRRILADVSAVGFAQSLPGSTLGHVLFRREATLMAQPFDASSGQFVGEVFPVAEDVYSNGLNDVLPATVSNNGMLLYASGNGFAFGPNQLMWYDRGGKQLGPLGAAGNVLTPAISPDEKAVAFRRSRSGSGGDIWIRDVARGTETRFTTDASTNFAPLWSPAGDRLLYGSIRGTGINLYIKAATGLGQVEALLPSGPDRSPQQWSRDGHYIVYSEAGARNKRDLWILPMGGAERKPVPFLKTEFEETHGQLSPDSQWMAFVSDVTGERVVYVAPFPGGDPITRVSTGGGEQPRWRQDGKELFYIAADGTMMAVPIKTLGGPKASIEPGTPVALFETHIVFGEVSGRVFQYDVTADGKRFLVVTSGIGSSKAPPLTVWLNWTTGLKR
jgi:Tol biopolymer transport system component/predicted Ser/Thr protein kinase